MTEGFIGVLSQLVTPKVIDRVRDEFLHLSKRSGGSLSREEFVAVLLPCTISAANPNPGTLSRRVVRAPPPTRQGLAEDADKE